MAETAALNGEKPHGLPGKSSEEKQTAQSGAIGMIAGMAVVPRLLGATIAYGITCIPSVGHGLSGTTFNSWIVGGQLKYVFLAVYIFNLTTTLLNMMPMYFKQGIMLSDGNLRANSFIYKDVETGKHVVLDEVDDVGKYNRANRSLHHFLENSIGFCASLMLAGSVFPAPAFVLCITFFTGRIMHQIGYTSGFGSHAPGFALTMLSFSILDGFVVIVAIKAFLA